MTIREADIRLSGGRPSCERAHHAHAGTCFARSVLGWLGAFDLRHWIMRIGGRLLTHLTRAAEIAADRLKPSVYEPVREATMLELTLFLLLSDGGEVLSRTGGPWPSLIAHSN